MKKDKLSSEIGRKDWYADQADRAILAAVLIGGSVWFGYAKAAADYAADAAKWREVAAGYHAAPEVGVALLRNLAAGE